MAQLTRLILAQGLISRAQDLQASACTIVYNRKFSHRVRATSYQVDFKALETLMVTKLNSCQTWEVAMVSSSIIESKQAAQTSNN